MIDISKFNKAEVLKVLYDRAKPQGSGFLNYDPAPMKLERAEQMLKQHTYLDYVQGRVMKVDLKGDLLDPFLYDRDNGQGAAEQALAGLSTVPKAQGNSE